MLTRAKELDLEQYAPWAYDLAMSAEHASYPSYQDGVKTRDEFMQRARRGLDDEEILLFSHENEMLGWIHWYAIPEEKYAHTVTFLVKDRADEAVAEFVSHVARQMPDAMLDIGLDGRNGTVACALERCGFTLLESSVNHTLFFERLPALCVPACVRAVTAEDEDEFRRLHDEPNMYWNADRILADGERWRSYLYWQNSRAAGVLCCMVDDGWPEIFAIEFEDDVFDPAVYHGLMSACVNEVSRMGCTYMTYFEEEEQALPILQALGFAQVGRYLGYRKELKEE